MTATETTTAGPATVPPCPAWCNVRPDDGYPETGYHSWMWDFGKWTRMHAREFAYWIAVDISEEVYPDGSVTHRAPKCPSSCPHSIRPRRSTRSRKSCARWGLPADAGQAVSVID